MINVVRRRLPRGAKAGIPSVAVLLYVLAWLRQARKPQVVCQRTARNARLLAALSAILEKEYVPSWLTPNGHVNSGLAFVKKGPLLPKTRELVRTWDGGNFALDWRDRDPQEADLPPDAPTVLVIHGLNGHSDEGYVLYAMDLVHRRGWRAVAMNHRGCGGTGLTSGWAYNGAFTGDVRLAVSHIRHRYPASPLFAVGYSLGANLLVKYLGEEGQHGDAPLSGAVAVSNPWDFRKNPIGGGRLSRKEGVGGGGGHGPVARVVHWFYSLALTTGLKWSAASYADNEAIRRRKDVDLRGALRASSLHDFDRAVIIPMWGYKDLEAYHEDASSCKLVKDVKTPLLCVSAEDDPICPPDLWPLEGVRGNEQAMFVWTQAGGHIGWGQGLNPFGREAWVDGLIVEYFAALLEESGGKPTQTALHEHGGGAGEAAGAAGVAGGGGVSGPGVQPRL